MLVTEIKIIKIRQESRLAAVVDLTLSDMIAVHDIKILKSAKADRNEYYFAMPSKLMGSEYFDLVHPISNEVRIKLEQLIFKAFDFLQEHDFSRIMMRYDETRNKISLLQQIPTDFKYEAY